VEIAHLYFQDPTHTGVFVGSYQNQIVEVVGWGKAESGIDSNSLRKIRTENYRPSNLSDYPEQLCITQTSSTIQVSFS
jgi:hypothetical protein